MKYTIFIFILFSIKLYINVKFCSKKRDYKNINKRCSKKLLNFINVKGLESSQEKLLPMFKFIKKSCCSYMDQFLIQKENEKLNKSNTNFTYQKLIKFYENFFENLNLINSIAKMLKNKKYLNLECKSINNSILMFGFNDIKTKLMLKIKKLINFFETSNKGIFGAVCNINTQQFFDFTNRNIIINYNFCRSLLNVSLPVLKYLYNLLIKYTSLIKKYTKICETFIIINMDDYVNKNFEDEFKTNEVFSKMIVENNKYFNNKFGENINICFNKIDYDEWQRYCNIICEKYRINSWQSIFFGNLSHFRVFNTFLIKKFTKYIENNKTSYYINIEKKLERMSKYYVNGKLGSKKLKLRKFKKNFRKIKHLMTDINKERLLEYKRIVWRDWRIKLNYEGIDFFRIGKNSYFKKIGKPNKVNLKIFKSNKINESALDYYKNYYKKFLSKNCITNLKYYNLYYYHTYDLLLKKNKEKSKEKSKLNCEKFKTKGIFYNNYLKGNKFIKFLNAGLYLFYKKYKNKKDLKKKIDHSYNSNKIKKFVKYEKYKLYKNYLDYIKLKNCIKSYKYSEFKKNFDTKNFLKELNEIDNKKKLFEKLNNYDLYKDYKFIYDNSTNKNLPWAKELKKSILNVKDDYEKIKSDKKKLKYLKTYLYMKYEKYKTFPKVSSIGSCKKFLKFEKFRFNFIYKEFYDEFKNKKVNFKDKTVIEKGKILFHYGMFLKYQFYSKFKDSSQDDFLGFYYDDYLNSSFQDSNKLDEEKQYSKYNFYDINTICDLKNTKSYLNNLNENKTCYKSIDRTLLLRKRKKNRKLNEKIDNGYLTISIFIIKILSFIIFLIFC